MIIQCQNIQKSFIENTLFENVSFILGESDRAALVGVNGAGKTTLFRIIADEISADQGQVLMASDTTLGYLKQNALNESDHSLFDEVYHANKALLALQKEMEHLTSLIDSIANNHIDELERLNVAYARAVASFEHMDGYSYASRIKGVLNGLGFKEEDYDKKVNTLSGGQKTRVALAIELIKQPDLLMLDEPTNHLDIEAIEWLETYLKAYKGTLLIISHDRYFLDRVTNKTIDLELGTARLYEGPYSEFVIKKQQLQDAAAKHYEQQQKEIKKQEEVIAKLRSYNREKSIKRAESREKLLGKMDRLDKPQTLNADMHLQLTPRHESGNDVLKALHLKKSFGTLHLFDDLNLDIKKGEKVAIIGDNGTGKSTLFKIITGLMEADAGSLTLGAKVRVGYYDQEHQQLNENNTLMEEISSAYPSLDGTQIRNILASYLFRGDDVFKKVGQLSGGEKGRVTLVKLMLGEANFLILDEPTNHLDMISKNILETALKGYQGTLLFISHDRYFVNKVADKILHLENKQLTTYLGNYDHFLEKKEERSTSNFMVEPESQSSENKLSWMESKNIKAEIRKITGQFEKTEALIHTLEGKLSQLDQQLSLEEVYTDHMKSAEITLEKERIESELENTYDQWSELSELITEYNIKYPELIES